MDDKEIVKKPEGTTENNDDGSKPKATRLIDDANLAAKRMEEANKEKKELLDREEELMSQARLSGKSLAGQAAPPEETEDAKWAREAKERYEGTGMDPTD